MKKVIFLSLVLLHNFSFGVSEEQRPLLINVDPTGVIAVPVEYSLRELGCCWGPGYEVYKKGEAPSDNARCVKKAQLDCCCWCMPNVKPLFVALVVGEKKDQSFNCELAWVDQEKTDLDLKGLSDLLKSRLNTQNVAMPQEFNNSMFSGVNKK